MAALRLERAPTTALPLRYLRLAPAWGAFAGLLLLHLGPEALASRWAPGTIALVHAFTLGVLGNALLGALLQFLPVVADARPLAGAWLGPVLPVTFNLGVLGLVCGLLHAPGLIVAAALVLFTTLAAYAACALGGLRFDGRQTVLRAGLAMALLGLLVAALFGLLLALGLSGRIVLPLARLTDAHAAIGVLGSLLLLTGTVGSVVMPMFQGTAAVPTRRLTVWIVLTVVAVALAAALRLVDAVDGGGMASILALPVLAFATTVLVLQWRAPHRRNGALTGFWRLGASALLAATVVAVAASRWHDPRATILTVVLGVAIGLPALVLGMLLEISAFLAWLDLQQRRPRGQRVPGVDALLPEARKQRVLASHAVAALALSMAAIWPNATSVRLVAVVLIAAYGLTGFELVALGRRRHRLTLWLDRGQADAP